MTRLFISLILATMTFLIVPSAREVEAQEVQSESPNQTDGDEGRDNDSEEEETKSTIKPYGEIVTEEAISDDGVIIVHQVGEDYFYEIPAAQLGAEFLWVGRIARTVVGQGYGGQKLDTRVVRWERRGEKVFLRNVSYEVVADENLPISQAVQAANNDTILMAFDIVALGEGDAPVIKINDLFATEVVELSARARLNARGFDTERSFVERIVSFPTNTEVRAVHTYTRPVDTSPPGSGSSNNRGMDAGSSATLELAYSMVKLPEEPMMPRRYDDRVGYFSVTQTDYGVNEHRSAQRRYITRWRLEKQNPENEISDPIKPIEYWVDPATPKQWIPYIKQGVEDWQGAFEEAGFSNAIVAREAPTKEQDPDWSPEDARYSVIRWLPSDIPNAMGPHVHDPRTGEILESDIQFYHNVQSLIRDWYFVQVSPLDPRAQTTTFPEELMGRLLRFVVAHEVGHTLGFQHNMKSSATYPFENIRDPDWLAEMGHTPSIMDYSRFNYVAQPEDNIPVELLVPDVGPYDVWATMWGYKPIANAQTPDDELETLNAWALEQETTPWLRFSTAGSAGSDPGQLTEAVGDANAIAATELGLLNLERVVANLLSSTTEEGKNWEQLEQLYGSVFGQWTREMNHVAAIIGGYNSQQLHGGSEGVRFTAVAAQEQKEAVAFLNANAFATPEFLIQPEVLRRIEASGVLSRLRNSQRSVLNFVLNANRFTRLVEQSAMDNNAYPPTEFLADLRAGIWNELDSRRITIDPYRRNMQRLYLDVIDTRLNNTGTQWDDMRASLRGQLRLLDDDIDSSLRRADDDATLFHLQDVRDEIAAILDPEIYRAERNSSEGTSFAEVVDPYNPYTLMSCWADTPN